MDAAKFVTLLSESRKRTSELADVPPINILRRMEASANGVADDSLDRVFFALSDPTRRAIVEQLLDGPRRVGELVLPRNIAAPTLSKHLSVLMKSGLLTQQTQGRARLCRLNVNALRPIKDWVEQHQPRVKSQRAALERYFGVAAGTA